MSSATIGSAEDRAVGITAWRVTRSEFIKLVSIRSNGALFLAAGAVILAYGVVSCVVLLDPAMRAELAGNNPAGYSLAGPVLGQLFFAVLGVRAVTSEYETGSIRSTLAAVPRRLPVLWAKTAVLAGASFAVALVALVVTFLVGQAVLQGGDLPPASLTDPAVLAAITGSSCYLAGIAVLGVGLGVLYRGTTAAAATACGVLLLADSLLGLAPASVYRVLGPVLPSNAGLSFSSIHPPEQLLSPSGGAAVFLTYLAVVTTAAALALRTRDV